MNENSNSAVPTSASYQCNVPSQLKKTRAQQNKRDLVCISFSAKS